LVRSFDDFQRVLKDKGRTLLNPAVYNSEANRIVCWSELQKLGEDMGRARKLNQQLLDELDQRKTDLSKLYKKVPADLLAELEEKRRQILKAKRANEIAFDATFRKTTQRLMQRLYHEAFHAYLANFVYPSTEAAVPVWLNEGMA